MKKLLIVLLLSFPLFGDLLEVKEGFVGAHTEMLMDSTIDPLNTHLHGKVNIKEHDILSLNGKLWIEMDLFTSDEPDRDISMDKSDEIDKYPLATYSIVSITKAQKKDMYVIHGTLDFHGVEKAFMADAEILDENDIITINATSSFLISDYGIEMPCMAFMCVRDKMDIFAKVVLTRK